MLLCVVRYSVCTSVKGAECRSLAAGENETEKEHWKRPYAHETTGIATQSVVTVGVILVNIRCGICCRGFVVE